MLTTRLTPNRSTTSRTARAKASQRLSGSGPCSRRYGVPPLSARPSGGLRSADLLLPIHIRKDDVELRVFSTIMTLGTPRDITLQELRLETFFPADRASDEVWTQLTAADIAVR